MTAWAWCSNCGTLAELKGVFAYQIHKLYEPYETAAASCEGVKEHDWYIVMNLGRQKMREKDGYLTKVPVMGEL